MRKDTRRPIRKCGKCRLNFRTHCGLFANPHEMWRKHRKCPGYMNESYYVMYEQRQEKAAQQVGGKTTNFVRREAARLRQTEAHHDGMHQARPRGVR